MATDPTGATADGAAGSAPGGVAARGLVKRFGRTEVLSGVTFGVAPGERVALIGPNGAGKSTLLRCLVGLIAADAGEVETLGERFSGAPDAGRRRRLRRSAGFVFQRHGLVRRLSALSNVCHGMLGAPGSWRGFSQGIAPAAWRARAMEALEEVGLADKATHRADRLSGGQAQRVAVARALVRRPRLVIADEPAASLDPAAGEEVMALFARLAAERGITLLFTTHDMAHALAYADRVVALRAGRIAFDRPVRALSPTDLATVFDGRPPTAAPADRPAEAPRVEAAHV